MLWEQLCVGDILNSRPYLLFKDTAHEFPRCLHVESLVDVLKLKLDIGSGADKNKKRQEESGERADVSLISKRRDEIRQPKC